MTTTVSAAVATQATSPAAMIKSYSTSFTEVLPSHVNHTAWIRLAQAALRRDRNLARIAAGNPGSLMTALLECARLGHEPGTEEFYLVPFGNEVQGIEGYRGVVKRIYRGGSASNVKAQVVYSNDRFHFKPTTMAVPDHEPDWFNDRGEIIGAYAYAELKDGSTSQVVVLNRAYLDKVKAKSRGSDKPTSPWRVWEEQMVLKTAAHRLEPWVLTSTEYRLGELRPELEPAPTPAVPGRAIDVTALPEVNDVIDGDLVDEPVEGDAA